MDTRDIMIKGFIKREEYDEGLEIGEIEKVKRYDGTEFDWFNGRELGNVLQKEFSNLDFPSYVVSEEDWTVGDFTFIQSVFLRFYISNSPATWDEVEKEHIEQMAGAMRIEQHYSGYSEYTIMDSWTDIFIGQHNLLSTLKQYNGKYLLLKITVKTNKLAD